jgi:hypothetical protein
MTLGMMTLVIILSVTTFCIMALVIALSIMTLGIISQHDSFLKVAPTQKNLISTKSFTTAIPVVGARPASPVGSRRVHGRPKQSKPEQHENDTEK